MDFIDISTMVGPWYHGDLPFAEPDALLGEMDRLGIKQAFTYYSTARMHNPVIGNPMLIDILEKHERLSGIMLVTPLIDIEFCGEKAVCGFMKQHRFAAMMLCPADHNFLITPWNLEDVFNITEKNNIPVFFDMRQKNDMLTDQYNNFYTLAKTFPNTPIVLLSAGYRHMRILCKLLDKCPNIYLDTANFGVFRGIEEIVKHFGASRILFGSRSPFIEAGSVMGRVLYADISEKDKELIAFGNAEKLIRGLWNDN